MFSWVTSYYQAIEPPVTIRIVRQDGVAYTTSCYRETAPVYAPIIENVAPAVRETCRWTSFLEGPL